MSLMEAVHFGYVEERRVRTLASHLSAILPRNASVLDVGCGSGQLARTINQERIDLSFVGIDVLLRKEAYIPVQAFNGRTIPFSSDSMEAVMLVDVLHHADDPLVLLREAARVARKTIIMKDHLLEGMFAESTLRFMDRVGNARYGVALPGNYWSRREWQEAFLAIGIKPVEWRERLRLYPAVFDLVFGRSLHFVAKLDVGGSTSKSH